MISNKDMAIPKTIEDMEADLLQRLADGRKKKGKGNENDSGESTEYLKNLTIKNKHMEVPKEESVPAREAEEVKARRTGAGDKDEKKPDISPEELKAIKDTAHYIQEHRMSNDPERQKYWAKKYGLDENTFTKENIEKVLSANKKGEWTPDAQKFMQDWDWETAKKAVRNMKKASEQTPDQKDATDDPAKPAMEDALKTQSKENQRQIDNMAIENKRMKGMENAEEVRKMEFEGEEADLQQAELNKAITDFEAKQAQIAEMRAKMAGRWASLRKTLGLETKNINEDPEVMDLEQESHELYRGFLAKGIHLYKGDKPQLENFLKQFDEFEVFKQANNLEINTRAKSAGFPENIFAGLQTLTKKWSELGWKQKVAISMGGGLLFAGGAMALGAGTLGATVLGAGWRWGFRGFGAAAAGVGKNVMLDRQMMTKMEEEAEARVKERMENLEKYENNLDQGIEDVLSKAGVGTIKNDFEKRKTENALRATRFAITTFAISSIIGEGLRIGSQATGINMGTILHKIGEKTGISLEGIKHSVTNFLGGHQPSAETAFSGSGGAAGAAATSGVYEGTIPKPSVGEMPGVGAETNPNVYYGTIQKPSVSDLQNGPGVGGYEPAGGGVEASHAGTDVPGHGRSDIHAGHDAPKYSELGLDKVKSGGSIERSAQHIIRANPKAFGLDPSSPGFRGQVGDKAHELAQDLRSRLGLKPEAFEKMASTRVQPGETVGVFQNPSTGKFQLSYEGKAFGGRTPMDDWHHPNTSANVTADHSSTGTSAHAKTGFDSPGGKAVPEHTGHGAAGSVAEHHRPVQVGGGTAIENDPRVRAAQEWQDRAQAKYAQAVDNEQKWKSVRPQLEAQNTEELARINHQVYLANRPLLGNVFHKFGISEYYNIYDQPMSKWDTLIGSGHNIAQDISRADAIDTSNASWKQLNDLHSILKYYNTSGHETIGECLRRSLADSRIAPVGRGESVGLQVQQAIHEILNNKK